MARRTDRISMVAILPDPDGIKWQKVTVDGYQITLKDWKAWMFNAFKVLEGEKAAIEKMYFAFGPELEEAKAAAKQAEEIKNAYKLQFASVGSLAG
jgi:hypothetical protein